MTRIFLSVFVILGLLVAVTIVSWTLGAAAQQPYSQGEAGSRSQMGRAPMAQPPVILPNPGERPTSPYPASQGGIGVFAFSTTVGDQFQQVTVFDSGRQVMSVYHVDLLTGSIKLCSVRDIRWDMQMMQYNGESPEPTDIQRLLMGGEPGPVNPAPGYPTP